MSAAAIHSLPCSLNNAARIASRLGIPIRAISLHRFPDEELRVTVGSAAATSIIFATLDRPAEKLLAIMFAAEALRRNGAERLVLVAPYMCYMRQDTAFLDGEAISQKVIGRLLAGTVDRIITVDAHLHRTTDIRDVFSGIEADNLSAIPAIAESLRSAGYAPRTIVAGPDAESRPWLNDLAKRLGVTCAIAQKVRFSDRSVEVGFADPELFAGRPFCWSTILRRRGVRCLPARKRWRQPGPKRLTLSSSMRCSPQSWPASSLAPAFAPSVRQTAWRIRPMRSCSMTPMSPHCAAR
jgi:ribose-phosphate pyrophosphokinase